MDNAINVLISQLQKNDHQGIANTIEYLHMHYDQDPTLRIEKVNKIIEDKQFFIDLWAYVKGRGNMIEINGKRQAMRNIIPLHFIPFLDGAKSVQGFIQAHVTRQFLRFIQGVTLFREDGDDVLEKQLGIPAYHRSASCGPDNASHAYKHDNMSCRDVQDLDELRRRRRNIWNCRIERLIYDGMYTRFFNEQNNGHKLQLAHVERDLFETCFAVLHMSLIRVKISSWDENVPIKLEISYNTQINPHKYMIITETYTRKHKSGLYEADVFGERVALHPDGRQYAWSKVTNFHNKNAEWIPMYKAPTITSLDPWTGSTLKYKTKLVLKW